MSHEAETPSEECGPPGPCRYERKQSHPSSGEPQHLLSVPHTATPVGCVLEALRISDIYTLRLLARKHPEKFNLDAAK